MKAVRHKAIIFLLKAGTPFPKNTMFLSGSSCLCHQGALLLFTSLWGQGQPKELPAGLNVLVMFFLNHYCLCMKAAQSWISVSQPHPKESACRQAPCPLLFSKAMTSKATISRNISCMVLENTHIIFLGSPPEVGASCIAGNVEHSNPLETGQRDRSPIALHRNEGNTTLSPAGERPSCQSTCSVNRKQPAPS